jgi:hypothetical protein
MVQCVYFKTVDDELLEKKIRITFFQWNLRNMPLTFTAYCKFMEGKKDWNTGFCLC